MRTLRFRLTGTHDEASALLASVHALDTVDRVEEVADQMHARDDTSSLETPGDPPGTDFHDIEVHARTAAGAEDVQGRIEIAARDLGVAVEFVDEF
jgi:hypothetical protein